MILNFDLHCHSRFSSDGVAEPEDIVAEARRKGLHGFAITDHNTCECVDYFERAGLLNQEGTPVGGILIIPGQEITTSAGHLLALGVKIPDVKGISPQEAIEMIHSLGGLAVPPHPYDFFRAGIREKLLLELDIDALEVFNAASTLKRYNRQAYAFAKKYQLPMTASSDAHHADAVGVSYTRLDADEFNVAGVLSAIVKQNELEQRYLTARDAFKKTFNNLWRFKKKGKRVSREPVEA